VATSEANDKRFHKWGQSESGMADIIKRFTAPGDTICDPFAGAGTTAVAAHKLGRRFIGAEIDPATHRDALRRLAEEETRAESTAPQLEDGR
jgi:DNA modification methylase